jgi:hypothetical protein
MTALCRSARSRMPRWLRWCGGTRNASTTSREGVRCWCSAENYLKRSTSSLRTTNEEFAGEDGDSRRRKKEARVGIFWLVDGKPVIDSTPLSKAENYSAFKVHPEDHCSVGERLQRSGAVPAGVEYDECPRGRVMYDTKARRFSLLADRCILKNKGVIRDIISKMNLPSKNTDMGTDSHCRCFRCLHGRREDPD